ncbi:hypothetical protein BDZ97DRAFT_1846307 [Flammula alnicola]|nr:hypothetical protein BDZ97DRAFT_1846307 [Flammula alnicola]
MSHQEPLPPPYTSSEKVLNGISLAYSTLNNPRGLECLWNSPYGQSFYELLSPYTKGQFITNSPYTLWLPALVRKEQVLRKQFQDTGLDYDAPGRLRTALKKARAFRFPKSTSVPVAGQSGSRKSERIEVARRTTDIANRDALEKEITHLLKERVKIINKQNELAKQRKKLGNDYSMESNSDLASFEEEPDIFVTHVETVRLPQKRRYELRGWRKAYHQCGAVIVELKKGPSRLLVGSQYYLDANYLIKDAQNDLLQYCSAYFACYPDATNVIAFATGGPIWRWANIQPGETPRWDFVLNCANQTSPINEKLAREWETRFSPVFQLGTRNSDKELTKINQQYIYPMLNHTPAIPAHLLEVEDDDEEEEQGDVDASEGEEDEDNQVQDRGNWPGET